MAVMNSDDIVSSLQPYGTVYVYQSDRDKGFSAKAKLFTQGMTAEVRSEFGHQTMLAALTELHANVMNVVERPASAKALPDETTGETQ